jgi:ribosomal protein S18 acetylase RimI-like enzyme
MPNIVFKPATPQDGESAVPLIYASGPPTFDFVFGNSKATALDFLNTAFKTKGGEFSFDNHTAMFKDHRLIGIGSAFSGKQAVRFIFADAFKILSFYGLKSLSIVKHGLQVEQIVKPPKKGEVAIAHLGVLPSERGNGYGQLLIENLIQRFPQSPDQKLVLDVSDDNPRARLLYERLGFVVTKTNPSKLKNQYGRVADHHRMQWRSQ